MGFTQPDISAMVRTHALSREERAERASNTVNKTIPELLRASPRARHGIHKSIVIDDPEPTREDSPTSEQPRRIRIRIKDTDTLTAARQMTYSSRRASLSTNMCREQATRRIPNVCILNQASAIMPGGGFLDGVHSQEEFLCQRSTLFASLWDKLYPLPDVGGVFSPDVLVFGDSTPEAEELSKRDRIYVDVITASMIRFPGAPRWRSEAEEVRHACSCGVSYCDRDRDVVVSKMAAVLRMAQSQGSEKLVLGAWGCGSYLNPPREVARLWKKAIFGTSRSPVSCTGIKEIVFAMTDRQALREFEKCFADQVGHADVEIYSPPPERSISNQVEHKDEVSAIINKIQDTEIQLAILSNPRTRGRLRDQLQNLNKQLAELGKSDSPEENMDESDEEDGEDGFVVHGYPASDNEDNSYYNFDENDVASSGSATPASTYEFRFDSTQDRKGTSVATEESFVHDISVSEHPSPKRGPVRMASFENDAEERKKVEESNGWFSGSVNELSALLRKTGGGLNPALSPAEPMHEQAAFPHF